MPEFILDTSGAVAANDAQPLTTWSNLDAFTQGYIEALFFTESSCIPMTEWHNEESRHRVAEGQLDGCLPQDAGFSDLHPDALASIIADCAAFQRKAAALLANAYERGYSQEQAGRDLWFTRNGHGVGYWDRDALEDDGLGRKLSGMCGWLTEFGEVNPWFSDEPDDSSPTGYGFVHV